MSEMVHLPVAWSDPVMEKCKYYGDCLGTEECKIIHP